MNQQFTLGVDFGATSIKFGVVQDGRITKHGNVVPTGQGGKIDPLMRCVRKMLSVPALKSCCDAPASCKCLDQSLKLRSKLVKQIWPKLLAFGVTQYLGVSPSGTVTGDFVVFYPLSRSNETRVPQAFLAVCWRMVSS
jgi:hypothetical protein